MVPSMKQAKELKQISKERMLTYSEIDQMEKAEEKFLAMKKIYTTLLGMFADEMKQEELEKDECYGCAYL